MGRSEEVLKRVVRSPVTVALVRFLHRNPGLLDSAEGLAAWIGREPAEVEKALEELARLGLVEPLAGARRTLYGYTRDENLLEAVGKWLAGMERT
jgi:predicted transcriptional regulator